jgi:hypothetical protein
MQRATNLQMRSVYALRVTLPNPWSKRGLRVWQEVHEPCMAPYAWGAGGPAPE